MVDATQSHTQLSPPFSLLNSVLGMVAVLTGDGHVAQINHVLASCDGTTLDEVRGRPFWACHWWSFDPDVQGLIHRAVCAAAKGEVQAFTSIKRMKDGSLIDVRIRLSRWSPPDDAATPYLIYCAEDFTAQSAGAEQLAQSEQRFQKVFEAVADGLIKIDQDSRIILANAEMERLFGYSRNELLGMSVHQLIPERHREGHTGHVRSYFAKPVARAMADRRKLFAKRKDGTEFPVEIGLNPIPTEEGPMVLATIQDVTLRDAVQQATEQALNEKTVLLNEVHHRVKNNLQVITSLLNLQARSASAEVSSALFESQGRVKAMALIHQLLYERDDFSNIDMGEYLDRLCSLLRESFRESRTRFALTVDAPSGVTISLKQAVPCGLLVNELVTNAIKHAFPEPRSGEVRVTLRGTDDGFDVRVSDNGIGLPENIEPAVTRTLGMQLIPLLADQAKGAWQLEREHGTHFEIRVKRDMADIDT
ncbi:PAS domain-containing sensor histidine kinase [Nitrogeniibacter aestuarii]|uniref:PAS domain-containing sensor histidine kinase n=1 Tax=Nitrogeniibacter aestuarii TaxID=2815343 RepID=UPI001D10C9C8|nr:PAS domain S-box protein [Nitrogeniibacter aestuarii]